jgi:hypothetical protein
MGRFNDPVDAALERIEADNREDDQFLGIANRFKGTSKALIGAISKMVTSPGPSSFTKAPAEIFQALHEDLSKRTEENQAYLLDAVVEKLGIHDKKLMEDSDRIDRLEDTVDHSLAYVGPNTSRDKLDRFAAIAVSGAMVYTTDPLEQTEEFLRIAASLQNTDVMVLREIGLVQTAATKGFHESQILHEIQSAWAPLLRRLETSGIQSLNYRSAFTRLQAFGLLERTEPNMSTNGLGETPYMLLELGERFLQYLTDHHQQKS